MRFLLLFVLSMLTFQVTFASNINKWELFYENNSGTLTNFRRSNNISTLDNDRMILISQKSINSNHDLLHTSNGGQSWRLIFESDNFEYELLDCKYTQENKILLVGDSVEFLGYTILNTHFKYYSMILSSSDNGETWDKFNIDSNSYLNNLKMYNDNIGIVAKKAVSNLYNRDVPIWDSVLYSNDFFHTYKSIAVPDSLFDIEDLYIFNVEHFIIWARNKQSKVNTLFETTDAGESWSKTNIDYSVEQLKFTNRSYVYKIQGYDGVWYNSLFVSSDGGENWKHLITPKSERWNSQRIRDISADSNGNIIISGNNTLLLVSNDAGNTWKKEFAPNGIGAIDLEYESFLYSFISDQGTMFLFTSSYIFRRTNQELLEKPIFSLFRDRVDVKDVEINWTSVENANKYIFQLVKSPANNLYDAQIFDNPENHIIDIETENISFTIENLDFNTCYYARVKAINSEMESEWYISASLFCTFQDENYTHAPDFIFPRHDDIIYDNSIEFVWSEYDESDFYHFQLYENNLISSSLVYDFEALQSPNLTIENLNFNQKYTARVKISDGYKISNWRSISFVIEQPTGLNETNNEITLKLYPNPASEYVVINEDNILKYNHFEICDIMGRIVQSGPLKDNNIILGNFPSGIYLLRLIGINESESINFVKH